MTSTAVTLTNATFAAGRYAIVTLNGGTVSGGTVVGATGFKVVAIGSTPITIYSATLTAGATANVSVQLRGHPFKVLTYGSTTSFLLQNPVGGPFSYYLFSNVPITQNQSVTFHGTTVASYMPCFVAGTRLMSAAGPVLVEDVRPGDAMVSGATGLARRVIWVGRRRLCCRRHPRPAEVWPVRIRQGAFGPGRPERDLLVSPDHAIFLRGVLIPARHLVDGELVAQQRVDEVTYLHVELEEHDLLMSEGLATESYLDTGTRDRFENGGGALRLHPSFDVPAGRAAVLAWSALACAPLVNAGPIVASVRAELRRRASQRGDDGLRIALG